MYLATAQCLKRNAGWGGDEQVLDILEAVSKIAEEWMVQMFQHPSFANDVPDAFRPDDLTHLISFLL
jgi:hypothetical protein